MTVTTKWIIIAIVLLLMPAAASTYVLLSPKRHWASDPVICVKSPGHTSIADSDKGITATINALNGSGGWNDTSVGLVLNAVSTTANNSPCSNQWQLGDGQPTIAFDEVIKGACSGTCLAATFISFYDCDPVVNGFCEILDADVLTRKNRADKSGGPYYSLSESGSPQQCTPGKEWNIEAIMVHEVGHVLGIGHTNVSGATMYPSVSSCNPNGTTIEQDDKDALNALY
ncbi:MAG: matrixin family metalloprotease [Deltaproteobacteria bacterium]|nr:matrixin family metalloprotease [Deltaproteobacteria bacterium]MDZ4347557.1 matrixin family metalloprotease [Candidatus Binatia bacterium]